jgi:hypothetical protein
MVQRLPFRLVYTPTTLNHLFAIERKYDSLIREKIEERPEGGQ